MDISLYSIDKGQGEPLILLHGNGESSSYFVNQIDYFARFRRVIAVDTRGHGASPMGTEPFSLHTFADDLYGFMWERNISRADILGFSDGGNIALLFALKYPACVNRLILNGANLSFSGLTVKTSAQILLGYIRYSILAPFSKTAAKNKALYRLMVMEPNIDPAELGSIRAPTLVIVGDRDMIRLGHSRLIAGKIPGAKLSVLPGTHFIASENSQAFNSEVKKFLEES